MHFVGFLRERSRFFGVVSGLVLLAMVGIGLPTLTPPAAAESAEQSPGALTLSLAPDTAFIAPDAQTVELSLAIENGGTSKVALSSIELYLSPTRILTTAELTALLASPELPEGLNTPLFEIDPSAIEANDRKEFTASVDTVEMQSALSNGVGVYALFANVGTVDGQSLTVATPIVWHGTATATATPVHAVVPLVLPKDIDGMPTARQLGELTSGAGLLSQNLASAIQRGSTLAIDPRIIAGTRALGDKAPASAVVFVSSLETAPNAKFALQYADADLSAQAQIGLEAPLEPKGFTFVGNRPSTEDLAAFPYTLTGVGWPRQNSVTSNSLAFMAKSGISNVLLDSRNVELSAGTSGTVGTLRAISLNSNLQDAAAGALTGETAVHRNAARAVLVSQLALINQSAASSIPQTIGLDRGGAAVRDVGNVLDTISSLPWVSATDFATVAAQQASATIIDSPLAAERLDTLGQALVAEPKIDEYGAVLTQPVYLSQLQRMRVLEFFATSIGVDSPGFTETTEAYFTRDDATLNGVRVSSTGTTNLVGTSTRIPIQVTNDLPFTAVVSAETLAANSSLLVEESETELTSVEKQSSVNITVPVTSRVSAGQSALIVTLFAKNGQRVDDAVLPVTIRSSWEALALGVLGVLVAGFFGFGIWRSLRARRTPSFAEGFGDSAK